jgi:hypothetical protein
MHQSVIQDVMLGKLQVGLRIFLSKIQDMIMHDQLLALEEEFNNWKGDIEQIDDVLIIGVKV